MFEPFQHVSQFYSGLILWCDPKSYDMEATTLPPNAIYDRRMRELRPCLVVGIDIQAQTIQVARLCATVPTDTRRWVRTDSLPSLIWNRPAWIWVGTPATINMVLNDSKSMHPHKDSSFTTPPVSVTNLESYRIHRQNYLNQVSGVSASGASNFSTQYYSTGSTLHPHMQSTSTQGTFNIGNMNSPTFNPAYSQNGYPGYNPMSPQAAPFNTLASQPVVVPAGFTETHPSAQGWWRNPTTGWFWSSTQGLLPPASGRGFGA